MPGLPHANKGLHNKPIIGSVISIMSLCIVTSLVPPAFRSLQYCKLRKAGGTIKASHQSNPMMGNMY